MRIIVAYPGAIFSTFDVAHNYTKALKDLGHDVHVFDYHTRLWFYSEALKHWATVNPTAKRAPSDNLIMASEAIILDTIEFVPDVILMVYGVQLHRRAFDLLHRLQVKIVLLLTESPYLDDIQAEIATKGFAAGLLTNDKNSVDRLKEATGLPTAYLPHSYNPDTHKPMLTVPEGFHHDVFFRGTLWPERQETFLPLAELLQDDYDIDIDGIMLKDDDPDFSGIMPNELVAMHYAGSKICINKHRTISKGYEGEDRQVHIAPDAAYSLGPRTYEVAACGTFQLSDYRPELKDVFNGSIPTYTDGADLLAKVRYYLTHDEERAALAKQARQAVSHCTFADRAADIVIPFLQEVKDGRTV